MGGKIHEAPTEEGFQGRIPLHQNGGQEGRARLLRHRTQGHGEERVQARRGEGKSGLPQRVETWRRRVKKQINININNNSKATTHVPRLSLAKYHVYARFFWCANMFLSLCMMNPLLILLLSLFHF